MAHVWAHPPDVRDLVELSIPKVRFATVVIAAEPVYWDRGLVHGEPDAGVHRSVPSPICVIGPALVLANSAEVTSARAWIVQDFNGRPIERFIGWRICRLNIAVSHQG